MKRVETPWLSRREWLLALLLVAATVVAYLSVWRAGFIWDDDLHLTKNPAIVGPLGFKSIWLTGVAMYYPLTLTSFWIQHAVWGLNPVPYHVVNVLVHTACAILLWRVLRHLNVRGAWLGAAIWALHPVQVESVAWITELKNTQSCFFYLLSILFFLKWRNIRNLANPNLGSWQYTLALFCALLAILSKSSTVMLPLVLGLCWWWMDGRWRWRNLVPLIPFLLVSLLASCWTIWEQQSLATAIGGEWVQTTWAERLIIAGLDVWFYLGKLAWPHPLIFIYPRWKIVESQLLAYLPALAAAGGMFILWRRRDGPMRPLFFATAYFIVSLFPVLGFFTVYFFHYSFVGDHFQYLASMGPLALAGAGITSAFDLFAKRRPFLKPAFCGALLSLLSVLTWRQTGTYRDLETLWRDTLDRNPVSWMVQNSVAGILLEKGQVADALAHLQEALELNPNSVVTHNSFGYALLQIGRVNESFAHLQKALEINPNYMPAHFNLANTLLQMKRVDEAVFHLQKVLTGAPGDAEAQKNMAWVLATWPDARIRDGAKAVELAEHANRTESGNPIIGATLAAAYAETGRFLDAIRTAEAALQLATDSGNVALAELIRAQIALYRSGRPFRDNRDPTVPASTGQ
jgi:tetratricopeptide (TPR) repeat protein